MCEEIKRQYRLVKAFQYLDKCKEYKEIYGKDWRQVMEEDEQYKK